MIFKILICLFGIVPYIQCDQPLSSPLENFLYKRCQQYSIQAAAYDNLKNRLDDFISYFKYTSVLLPGGKEQFCHDEKPKLEKSLLFLVKDMNSCFPSDEKYLPKFLYDSFREFLTFLCDNHGRNIDNIFSSQTKDCGTRLGESNANQQVIQCFEKIIGPFNGNVRKSDLCSDLDTAKRCFSITVEQHCNDYRAVNILLHSFFDHITKPCTTASLGSKQYNNASWISIAFVVFFVTLFK